MSQFEGKAGGGFLSPSPPSSPQHMAHSHIHSSAEQLGFGVSSNPSHSESCCEGTAVQPLIFPQKDSHWYNAWLAARSISVAFCSLHLREKPLNCDGHSFPWKRIVGFWQSGSSKVSPHRGSSDVVYHGVPVFPVLHTADPTMQALPCLSLPLFLIIELNGIKSFSIGILFSALALLNNLRGILTCYYPLTQCWYWK